MSAGRRPNPTRYVPWTDGRSWLCSPVRRNRVRVIACVDRRRDVIVIVISFLFVRCCAATNERTTDFINQPVVDNDQPEFIGYIANVTYPAGREAQLTCTVKNLGKYKVSGGGGGSSDRRVLHPTYTACIRQPNYIESNARVFARQTIRVVGPSISSQRSRRAC